MNAVVMAVHGLAATIWVGGMFFAYVVLRPSAAMLEPHRRLTLWTTVFKRFFPWVWASVVGLLLSGYWLVFKAFGGFSSVPLYVHIMHLLGLVMFVVFVFLYFRPYPILRQYVDDEDWPAAATALNGVRQLVLINLLLGLLLLVLVYAGRYGLFI